MRILVDTSILRRPRTGIGRGGDRLVHHFAGSPDDEVILAEGPARLGMGGRAYRIPNTLRQRWWYRVALPRLASRSAADIILCPANFAARRSAVRQVVTLHDVNFLTAPGTYERADVAYLRRVYRHAIDNADVLTTVSEHSRSQIAAHFAVDSAPIRVVYPGLSPTSAVTPRSSLLGTRPYALYVGATEAHKNIQVLLEARAASSPGGLHLAHVGQPGRAHEAILGRAATMGGRVIVRGRVEDLELEAWYGNATVFLFPSLSEGFGYPSLEAMARGVPVVASSAGSLPEVLGDAARYHEPGDAEEIRRLFTQLVEDPSL